MGWSRRVRKKETSTVEGLVSKSKGAEVGESRKRKFVGLYRKPVKQSIPG